jgi:rod shape-determining protein MreC
VSLVAFLFAAVALLVLSRLDHGYVRPFRWQLAELMAPALASVSSSLAQIRQAGRTLSSVFDLAEEVERLRDQNQRLKGWEWRAKESERRLSELAGLSGLLKEQPAGFVTSRVIAHASGPFVRSALINAGRENGIKTGYPVLSGDGLVGRIVETGTNSAQVLLLTDLNSRIPVLVGRAAVGAVMTGDNGPTPRLAFLPPGAAVEPGDEVATSGVGGLFPRGLRIGTVVGDANNLRVRPHAALDTLEFLSVLFHETPALGLVERGRPIHGAGLETGGGPAPPAAPRPDR